MGGGAALLLLRPHFDGRRADKNRISAGFCSLVETPRESGLCLEGGNLRNNGGWREENGAVQKDLLHSIRTFSRFILE